MYLKNMIYLQHYDFKTDDLWRWWQTYSSLDSLSWIDMKTRGQETTMVYQIAFFFKIQRSLVVCNCQYQTFWIWACLYKQSQASSLWLSGCLNNNSCQFEQTIGKLVLVHLALYFWSPCPFGLPWTHFPWFQFPSSKLRKLQGPNHLIIW